MHGRLVLVGTMVAFLGFTQQAAAQGGGDRKPDLMSNPQAVKRFLDMRVGLSVHWGPSSQTGYEISWSRGQHHADQRQIVPIEQYDALYKTFNPSKFNAEEWAGLMNRWGMKYVLPTGKHHDGFSLWFSRQSDYTMKQTPFHRDIMKELGDAARRHGVVFGSYYSNLDWYHPDWPTYRGGPGPLFKKYADSPRIDRYLEYMRNQLTELIKEYGVEILQFDGDWDGWSHEVGSEMYRYLHEMAPKVVLNSRVDIGRPAAKETDGEWDWKKYAGDYEERERYVSGLPSDQKEIRSWADHPCQSWITVDKRQWAWNPDPDLLKPEELVRDVVTIVGGNCNVAINVAPRPDGTFHPDQIAIMDKLGEWLRRNGVSIYDTRGGPFYPAPWGVSTRSGKRVYLHVLDGPHEQLSLPPLKQKLISARILTGGHKVKFRQTAKGIEVTVPEPRTDRVDTIVALDFDHEPEMQDR